MSTGTASLPQLGSLSLDQKAAQLLMIDIPDQQMSETTRAHLAGTAWNGVILFAKNVAYREQVVDLVEAIHQASPIPPWLSVDQEGGLVDRFRFPEMSPSPGLMALGATDDPEAVYQAHRIMGTELADLGMHVDFAPCLDVNNNPRNPIIGARSLGEDPTRVAELGRAAIRGLRDGGVAACAKHFPGHGDTSLDSHLALPVVDHPRARLEQVELAPFAAAVAEQVEAIMTAHIVFPAFDPTPGLPATLSRPILTGLLRERMGYQGVIVTDSLSMKAIADNYGMGEATVRSVEAGADLVLALGSFPEQAEAFRALRAAVETGRISEARLDQSLTRLLALKQRFCARPSRQPAYDAAEHQVRMRELARRTVTLVSNRESVLPLRGGRVLVLSPDLLPITPLGEMEASRSLAASLGDFGGQAQDERFHISGAQGPAHHDLVEKARTADTVVMALYGRDRLPDVQRELAEAVLKVNPRTVLVSLSSPYLLLDLPEAAAWVMGYNYSPMTLEAVADVLTGRLTPSGRLPVSLPGHYARGHGL